ncbi:putative amidase [Candida tropicalis]
MPEAITFESFLTKDPLDNYEDHEKYTKEWLPKIEKYRSDLEKATPKELTVELPKPIDELIEDQFNAVDYLYSKKLLTPEEFAITDLPTTELAKKIASGELTSIEVFKAYAHRAIICHQFTNCGMEIFIDEGLKQAEERDKYFKDTGKTVGPLHGIPISLKEHLGYKDKITHASYVSRIDNITKDHCVTTQILENLGAVFYIRTNEPQTLMHTDSNNNITGLTKNPFNLLLSSGGSSSGEGALIAFGGSSLGVGTDIGGSIRIPAAFSGCLGLRPTANRISLAGCESPACGQESVMPVIGPMGRSVEDIELWMKSYINIGKPWNLDPTLVRMEWREVEVPKVNDLTIAVIRDDGLVRVSPPVRRALDVVVNKLKDAGVKVIEFTPPNTELAYETINKMYNADGNVSQKGYLAESGEPLTKLTKWSLNFGTGEQPLSVLENRRLNVIRDQLRAEYNEYLMNNKIDFILSPSYNNVAPHSEAGFNWSYTTLFNILDLPTLVFQTGIYQDPKVDKWTEEDLQYKYRSPLEQFENENYDPEKFKGAPVGLQLSGRRYFDEEVLAAGKAIVDLLGVDLYSH